MRFKTFSVALGLAAAVAVATPALAGHNHPSKAHKFLSYFVQAYTECDVNTAPLSHNAPLAFPACTPLQTGTLTFGVKGSAQAQGVVKLNSSKQATDVALIAKAGDLRSGTNTGPLFTGNLTTAAIIRVTDHHCTTPGECTLIDVPFPVPLPCTNGKCLAKTSANAVLAGAVVPGKQANVELGQLQIYNGASLEFVEGIWLP